LNEYSRLLRRSVVARWRSWAAVSVLAWALMPAQCLAQQIPDDAKLVWLTFTGRGDVLIGDARYRISPAVRIVGPGNRLMMPASLRGRYPARVLLNTSGDLWRAWIGPPRAQRPEPNQP